MRRWIIAAAAAAAGLISAAPALADTLPVMPPAMPQDLDTTFLTDGDGTFLFMSLPKPGARQTDQPIVWLILGWASSEKADYTASYHQIDCQAHRMRSFGSVTYDGRGKLIERQLREPAWEDIQSGTIGGDAEVMAYRGVASPERILHGLAQFRTDLDARRRAPDELRPREPAD
ncbi:hypothetical protein QO010_002417 [Caulobacter ginsengisoli]|uniref:Uncharacterized protein n=1 Tax=Caulobacter ginsengisoli TaxID=400775 RepID=A0ABU0IRJ2_9CAUL|nr:hypothetical protein [Caulobacter ginsengisoli]MDQ0464633.1 hypothetical protein [Caulobacter ginsengisoli]